MRPPTLARGRRGASPARLTILLAAVVVALPLSGCTSSAPTRSVLPAAFADGVPAPSGEVVLTLTGPDGPVEWDVATLEQLDVHQLTVLEPFVEEQQTFTGPHWRDVLAASGIDAEDGPMTLVALDDYTITLTTDPAELEGVLLATTEGGVAPPVERGGPIRIVFPEGSVLGANLNNWIWELRTGTAS